MIHANPEITLLTSSHCPDCNLLKRWLTEMRIPFSERPLFDTAGVHQSGPLTVLNDRIISGPVSEQKKAIFDALTITVLG
jgi:hypothetical protein